MLPAAHAPALCLETLYGIRPETWLRLLLAYGAPRGLALPDPRDLGAPSLSPSSLESALVRSAMPDALLDNVATVEAFASDGGRRAIYEAQRALNYARPPRSSPLSWRHYVSPADHAAGVLASAAVEERTRELVTCATIRVARSFPPRSWYQFIARCDDRAADDNAIGEPTQYVEALTRGATAWADDTDRGPYIRVRAFGDLRKAHFEFAHEDWSAGAVVTDAASLALGVSRPVRSHLVSYDASSRRLFVWTAMPELVFDLVAIVARELFGDADHFFQESAVSLDALQARSADGKLPVRGSVFGRMSLIGFVWDTKLGHTISPRGKDAYAALRAHGIGVEGGEIRLATIRAETAPGVPGPRTADLSMRPPYTATCSEPAHALAFLREADQLGITNPTDARRDWWSFWPGVFGEGEWRAMEGGDALSARGAIVRGDHGRLVAHPRHPHAGRIATAHASGIRGKRYCVAEDPLFGGFLVDEASLAEWRLDWDAVAGAIAKDLDLARPRSHGDDDDGFVTLGVRSLAPARIHWTLCTRAPQVSALDRRRKEVAPDLTIFVVPERRALATGFAHVTLASLAGPYAPLLEATVRALGLENVVEPSLYAPKDKRLVVHLATKQIYFDGLRILKVNDAIFKMLVFLAANIGRFVETRPIVKAMSPRSDYLPAARKTMDLFEKLVTATFRAKKEKAPKDVKAIFEMGKLGEWRLGVPVLVV